MMQQWRRSVWAALLTLATLFSFTGCSSSDDESSESSVDLSNIASAMITDFYALSSREFAAYRKALLVLGHYATKRSKKQTVSEAVLFSIGESSDIYVYDYFED